MKERIAERPDDHRRKANAVMGLVHIGFDEEAIALIEAYKEEPWFVDDWDVNFYAGSLFFRYREYARSIPYLEAAHRIHPDVHTRLWLSLALTAQEGEDVEARRKELFRFGDHMRSARRSSRYIRFIQVACLHVPIHMVRLPIRVPRTFLMGWGGGGRGAPSFTTTS